MDIQSFKDKMKNLDPEVHKSLIDALNEHLNRPVGDQKMIKGDLTSDPFAEMFKKAVDELNRKYIGGTINHIRKHHPGLYQRTKEVENQLNEIWKKGLKRNATPEDFRDVLKEWYLLHTKSIETYKNERKEIENDGIK